MRRNFCIRLFVLGTAIAWLFNGPSSRATDIESFEFNDATGTTLDAAANTAHPGNSWFVDSGMAPSEVAQNVDGRPGSYYILKSSTGSANNFLQIDDVTSGTRYLTAKIAGWDFEEADQEQFRLAFLNSDTEPSFGNLITAQVSLVRGTDGTVELTGGALGPGSAPIVSDVTFPAVHTGAFEMTLALDRTANKYKVFYRDEGGPTQVLGTGYIDPTRDGKAIRMQATGNYANFVSAFPGTYGVDYIDFFALDRVALTDTNPHTDLITLEIDRDNGQMTLRNTSGSAINGIESYSIASAVGGLNPTNWTPIAGGGNTSSSAELMQSFGAAINLTNNQSIVLSNASGAWLKSPQEDLTMVLNLTGGVTRTVNVSFIDNGGERFMQGDFNFDNAITVADYQYLVGLAESDLSGLSLTEAYRQGDLNGDNANDIRDFAIFKDLYNAANGGAGAFEAMLAAIPEPNAALLAGIALVSSAVVRRRRTSPRRDRAGIFRFDVDEPHCKLGDTIMRRASRCILNLCLVAVVVVTCARSVEATVLQDFTFSEPNGTLLGDAENSADPGNSWTVSANTVESSILNGNFRIQKQSIASLASNYIDIANVTNTKAWLVADIAGWDFTETAAGEDVRFAFLDNDTDPPSGSTITSQMRILRSGAALALEGTALGTGAVNISGTYALPLVQSNPFTMVLELDKTNDQYSVYYKDGANPFAVLGTESIGASTLHSGDRDGNSIRFGFTGTFGDIGEYFDVDRIYLTDTNPITDVVGPATLSLIVNTSTRDVFIKNEADEPISFDSYRIASATDSLSFSDWASLSDRNPALTPFDGPDGGTTAGDSPGELWAKAGGSDDGAVSESFLLSDTTLSPDDSLDLGKLFKSGGLQDLLFQYHDAVSGAFYTIEPTYVTSIAVPGDYNEDGIVNAADYTIWRNTLGSTTDLRANGDNTGASVDKIDQADYAFWKVHFGQSSGSGAGSVASSAVPEPAAMVSLVVGMLIMCCRREATAS